MRFTSSAALLFAASLATACGGPLEEDAASTGQEGEAASASDALIVLPPVLPCLTSSTVLAQPDGATVPYVWNCRKTGYVSTHASSVDATYTQSSCVDRFVVDVTSIGGRSAKPFVEAAPTSAPTSRSACENLSVTADAWAVTTGAWMYLGTVTGSGSWLPSAIPGIPGYCRTRFYIPGDAGYSKVRVTGIATSYGTKIPVRTGAEIFEGNPC
ncbi:hypothetical protein D7Y13_39430 [Corallococcus praedator]|uniref:Lipoprotein n=1 Tax=Corallococcus praedator TaxID=2316724 RepID=A0ABX9Q835_9BACT|nr:MULTISPECIES: hypothetical protein [Corallococcus]RKH32694.1 hypothetical protein D7X75_14870 [Corallococcus sp. CA031C]RKH90754.1 hypothetical protein D7Y13_39430 [Corallococcus praedator]